MTAEEQIYEIYPRHVALGAALPKIRRAIKKLMYGEAGVSMTWEEAVCGLIIAVSLYAKTREGEDPAFTPHPATWFNQSRYLDDKKEWVVRPESRQQSIARANSDSFAQVFGKLPEADKPAVLSSFDDRRAKGLGGNHRFLFPERD